MRIGQLQEQDAALKTNDSPAPKKYHAGNESAYCTPTERRSEPPLDRHKALQTENAELQAKCKELSEELEFTTSKLKSSESLLMAGLKEYCAKYDDLKSKLEIMTAALNQLQEVDARRTELAQAGPTGSKFPHVMVKALISTIAHEIFEQEYIDRGTIASYCEEILSQMDNVSVHDLIPAEEEQGSKA